MGQKVNIIHFDDIDGTEGPSVKTFHFAVDGKAYEIDVTEDKAEKVREILSEYIRKGRLDKGDGSSAKAGKPAPSWASTPPEVKEENKRIREWAAKNGIECPSRGRIPQDVRDAYHEQVAA